MSDHHSTAQYVGQVERDPNGQLWAMLYFQDEIVTREAARSLRRAKRRVSDLVLAAADNYPNGPSRPPVNSRLASLPQQAVPAARLPVGAAQYV